MVKRVCFYLHVNSVTPHRRIVCTTSSRPWWYPLCFSIADPLQLLLGICTDLVIETTQSACIPCIYERDNTTHHTGISCTSISYIKLIPSTLVEISITIEWVGLRPNGIVKYVTKSFGSVVVKLGRHVRGIVRFSENKHNFLKLIVAPDPP